MNKARLIFIFILLLVFLIGLPACKSTVTALPDPTQTTAPTSTPTLFPTPAHTDAPASTQTQAAPTASPSPKPTQMPLPTLSGSGGGVLAFASDDGRKRDIYLMNVDGTGMIALTQDVGWDNWPSWSPDGRQLAFTCRAPIAGQGGGICRISADGSGRDPLTSSNDWEPSWSPDGRYIAFASQRDGNPEIYMMNADGTNQRRLTHSDEDDWQAAWSPDSKQLAFARGMNGNWDIYIMDVSDGGIQGDAELIRLTDNDVPDGFPAWSPDGKRIIFSSQRDGNKEIYIMNADGTDQLRLTNNDVDDSFPRWSPDGQWIVFVTATVYSGIHSSDLMMMNMDDFRQRLLTRTSLIEEACPDWRPLP